MIVRVGVEPDGDRPIAGTGHRHEVADVELLEREPPFEREERVVGAGLDAAAGGKAQLVHRLHAAREDVAHVADREPVVLVEGPDRDVVLATFEQLAERDLTPVVGPRDLRVGGEATRLTQIGEHRPLVGPHLELAGQLRQRDDRAVELASEDLQTAADLGHLDLAVLGRRPAGHELQVVDDHEAQVTDTALEPAGLGPQSP